MLPELGDGDAVRMIAIRDRLGLVLSHRSSHQPAETGLVIGVMGVITATKKGGSNAPPGKIYWID